MNLAKPGDCLELRHRVLQEIRRFFIDRGYREVETPVRVPTPALELHIDAVACEGAWLRTSPELHMKRLLAGGHNRIFQLGPCFRAGEHGDRHRTEFTMLEWYAAGCNYNDLIPETRALLLQVAGAVTGSPRLSYRGRTIDLAADWADLRVETCFEAHAGWNPVRAYDPGRFELDLLNRVEPALPADRPALLRDYPAPLAALARTRQDDPAVAERWELYAGGLELANAFSELTDPDEQERRFEAWAEARRAAGRPVYPPDRRFLNALRAGLPPCAGIALGVDRLLMLLADTDNIADVRLFDKPEP